MTVTAQAASKGTRRDMAALVAPERKLIGLAGQAELHDDGVTCWEIA